MVGDPGIRPPASWIIQDNVLYHIYRMSVSECEGHRCVQKLRLCVQNTIYGEAVTLRYKLPHMINSSLDANMMEIVTRMSLANRQKSE